ncbi:unnamed protein product [Closterium sp. Yama58-4]|nr:unnamed protein product [Closterium sp. Yama58-4]
MNYTGILAALFYGLMSVASVFINKALFHVYRFKFPYTLVFFQTLFTLALLAAMRQLRLIRVTPFHLHVLRRVSLLSFAFLLKLLLDMAALSRVNIPMYGVLKSATTPFVLLLDFLLRAKHASPRIQLAVYTTALGGVVAGAGDLTFDPAGYVLALSSALATAAYVVIVGKLGEELQLDSFTLLLYNNCWSLPFAFLLVAANGELPAVQRVLQSRDAVFLVCFALSCASAFILNLATYLCTLVNDSLTTSIVGRTKSILQGFGGLFAFGDVLVSPTNLIGLIVNSGGVGWYAYEKYVEAKAKQKGAYALLAERHHHDADSRTTIARDGSQVTIVFDDHKKEDLPETMNGTFSRPEVAKAESASRLKIVAQAQAGAGAGSSPEPKAVSTTEADDLAFKVKIGGYFALWWTLNVVFNIYNKKVLNAFPFPWLCSTLALAAGVTIMLLSWATRLVEFPDTDLDFWKTLFPVAVAHTIGHVAATVSMSKVAVSFTHIIKSSEPAFSVVVQSLMGEHFALPVYLSLLPIIFGCGLAALTELNFNMGGFMGAMISNLAFVFRNIFSKKGMSSGKKVGGLNYYACLSIMSLIILIPFAIWQEGFPMWTAGWQTSLAEVGPRIGWWIAAQSVFYHLYNQVSYMSLDQISPLTFSIGNTMKRVSVIVASIIIFRTPVRLINGVGAAIAILGTFLYSQSIEAQKKAAKAKPASAS